MDGQQHVHQKSTELLSCLAAYYTAGVESSDKQLTYADLYGYTKDYAKTQIIQVSPAIITEIEAEVDEKGRKYVVEFLKMFSRYYLVQFLRQFQQQIYPKGFAKVTKPVERCQYYMANNHPGAMQHEKGYQVAMSIIDRYVYMSLVPRLKDYYGGTVRAMGGRSLLRRAGPTGHASATNHRRQQPRHSPCKNAVDPGQPEACFKGSHSTVIRLRTTMAKM